jgi:amino acid transporter
MIFAAYARQLFGFGEDSERIIAAVAIIILALTNVRSVVWGAVLNNAATAAKVAALAGIALLAFIFGDPSTGALAGPVEFEPLSWGGFGVALIAVLWAYDGWADLTFIAGEVKDPGRTMPRALLMGTSLVVVLYLIINVAYLYVLPIDEMANSTLVASDAATKIFGAIGASIIAAAVMLSAFGALNGSTITGPRILYAMADDGLFFKPIAWVHPRWKTPAAAILLCAALGVGYVTLRSFEQLADAFIIGIWPFYALAVGAGPSVQDRGLSIRADRVSHRVHPDAREFRDRGADVDAVQLRDHSRRHTGLFHLDPVARTIEWLKSYVAELPSAITTGRF